MPLKIEIYSDVICPWCYLGKRHLELALRSIEPPPEVEIQYLPFELNPAMPEEGLDRKRYLESKYGFAIEGAHRRLESWGKEAGITYRFEDAQKIPNTFNAHRVIWLAGKEGVQPQVVEALFKGYFTDLKELGNQSALAEIADSAGLSRSKVEGFLKGQQGVEEVRALEEKAYNLGLSGVPHFIFEGAGEISGAHPVETFVSILAQWKSSKA